MIDDLPFLPNKCYKNCGLEVDVVRAVDYQLSDGFLVYLKKALYTGESSRCSYRPGYLRFGHYDPTHPRLR